MTVRKVKTTCPSIGTENKATGHFLQMHLPDHSPTPFPSCTTLHTLVNCYCCQNHTSVTEAQGWKAWWVLRSWTSLPAPDPHQTNFCWESASFGVPNHCCNKAHERGLTPGVIRKEIIGTCTFHLFDFGSTFWDITSSKDPGSGSKYCGFLYFIICFKGRKTSQPIKRKFCNGTAACDLITYSFYEL